MENLKNCRTTVVLGIIFTTLLTTMSANAQKAVPVDVKATNTTAVKSQDDGARQAVGLGTGVNFSSGSNRAIGMPVIIFTVPAGKRLVLDFWSAEAHVPIGQRAFARVSGCASNDIFLPLGDPFSGGSASVNLQVNAGELKAYCNPGDNVDITVDKNTSSGLASAGEVTFFGHLINLS